MKTLQTVTVLQDAAVAVGNGNTATSYGFQTWLFQAVIATTATVTFEGSLDGGTTWVSLGTLSANGKLAVNEPWPLVRGRISAWTAGAVSVYATGA